MNLSSVLAVVTEGLATAFAPLQVESHGGRFVEKELPLQLGKAPCILVAVLSLTDYKSRGRERWQSDLRFGAYCLGADTPSESRTRLAMDTALQIVDLLPTERWGFDEQTARPPEVTSISAENLYTGHVNNLRIALWAVAWTQTFHFDHGV
ncbi:MAG: hypothetical protein WAT67_08005 [Candidatus Contendobacter sp.]